MRLTAFTDYGLRMLMRMASAPDRAFSSAELAQEFGLSRHHLAKIMQRLAQGNIIATRRGGGGGAVLTRPPDAIRLGDVVRLLEDGQAMVACFASGDGCALDGRCRLKSRLVSAQRAYLDDLNTVTLAEIALTSNAAPAP